MFKTAALNSDSGAYVDKNIGAGTPGTRIEAADRNVIQAELVASVESAGQTLKTSPDLTEQLPESLTRYASGGSFYEIAAGSTADDIIVQRVGSYADVSALLDGFTIRLVTSAENTTAMTLQLPGLSAKSIVNVDGSALAAGEVKSGSYIEIVYNASADKFFLVLNVLNSTLGIPTGGIILWSGTVATIPAGFAICDGTNGTPDLTGQFVVHADADTGGTYAPGDSGGSDTHGHSDDFSVDDHTLTIAEMPAHTHDLQGGTAGSTDTISVTSTDTPTTFGATESTGGGDPHGHTLSGSVTDATTLPPYYALAYIMKL